MQEAGVVAWWVGLPPAVLASYLAVDPVPAALPLTQLPAPTGRPDLSSVSWLQPNFGHGGVWGINCLVEVITLSPFLLLPSR